MSDPIFSEIHTTDNFVPMTVWSKDHWSMLAYINSVMTETGTGFQVGFDPRMSQNRRNFRIMKGQCPNPKRPKAARAALGQVMDERHSSRIREEGHIVLVRDHDDWASVQDMANEEFFTVSVDEYDVGDKLKFSDKGFAMALALTKHKQDGGNFANFQQDLVI